MIEIRQRLGTALEMPGPQLSLTRAPLVQTWQTWTGYRILGLEQNMFDPVAAHDLKGFAERDDIHCFNPRNPIICVICGKMFGSHNPGERPNLPTASGRVERAAPDTLEWYDPPNGEKWVKIGPPVTQSL